MKKIMFNDRYGLHDAVMNGTKTMTRRIVPQSVLDAVKDYQEKYYAATLSSISVEDAIMNMVGPERMFNCAFRKGEIVAIAMSYAKMANSGYLDRMLAGPLEFKKPYTGAGYNNKMFVKAELMPDHIKITNIRVERLQDISDEDCLREGITNVETGINHYGVRDTVIGTTYYFYTPREAFAFLIDRVGKRGTWDSNPYVFAYECERID